MNDLLVLFFILFFRLVEKNFLSFWCIFIFWIIIIIICYFYSLFFFVYKHAWFLYEPKNGLSKKYISLVEIQIQKKCSNQLFLIFICIFFFSFFSFFHLKKKQNYCPITSNESFSFISKARLISFLPFADKGLR